MAELHCIGDALALGVSVDELEALIRVQGGSNVESLLCSKVPRPPCDSFGMDEDPTTNWPKRRLIEVKRTLEVLPSADSLVECGLAKEIEGKFCLWEKQVPEIRGKRSVHPCQDRLEVAREHADGALRLIPAVHVWGRKLELGLPLDSDGFLVPGASLIVENLEVIGKSTCRQSRHDGIVGCNPVPVIPCLERLLENEVVVGMVGDHHILVA